MTLEQILSRGHRANRCHIGAIDRGRYIVGTVTDEQRAKLAAQFARTAAVL